MSPIPPDTPRRSLEPGAAEDARFGPVDWDPAAVRGARGARLLTVLAGLLALWYLGWLLQPDRIGHPVLYAVLVVAELASLTQAVGFWWTISAIRRARPGNGVATAPAVVDVLVPVYDEPVDVIEPTVAAATRLRGAEVRVTLCDDGCRPELESVAARHGADYLPREESAGAKSGNLNHALQRTSGEFVAVFDSDHVAYPDFLERTLPDLRDPRIAFVQTPQYYANAGRNDIAGAAWEQQGLFFGPIARGKDGLRAMFCCGTNVVFRRRALAQIGGFPMQSVTEDFELSIRLHEQGWRSAYVSRVLAQGLAPEDSASYVGQQDRWARGCLSALGTAARAKLPWRLKLQYLLSAGFFLTGWTYLVYLLLPVVRIVTGAQPIADATADRFIVHFGPYFGFALLVVSAAGAGGYTFRAYAVMVANYWLHIRASLAVLLGRGGGFTVTPKHGVSGLQLRAVWPTLLTIGVLACAVVWGLARDQSPSTLNNVGFACLHLAVLLRGAWAALAPSPRPAPAPDLRDAELAGATR